MDCGLDRIWQAFTLTSFRLLKWLFVMMRESEQPYTSKWSPAPAKPRRKNQAHPGPINDEQPLMPAIIKQIDPNSVDLLDYRGH
jgi:hypothetical protein